MNLTTVLRSARTTLIATTVAGAAVAGVVVAGTHAPDAEAHRPAVAAAKEHKASPAAKEWRKTTTTVLPAAKEWRRTASSELTVVPAAKEWRRTTSGVLPA
jgi:PP-loop superfamily ATP-utilizing enzyme